MYKLLLALALCFYSALAQAAPIATISQLIGVLHVVKVNGDSILLGKGSTLDQGDMITTGKESFARLKLIDGGEMTLRPETSLKIESYNFIENMPAEDKSVFNLIKGGFRIVTGLISKRGDKKAFILHTPTATIGIRGTDFFTRFCGENDCGAKKRGTHTHTNQGGINLGNKFGEIACDAGESCFSGDTEVPTKENAETDDIAPFELPLPFLDDTGTDGGNSGLGCPCRLRG